MKRLTKPPPDGKWLLSACLFLFMLIGCKKTIDQPATKEDIAAAKTNNEHGHLKQTTTHSSDVVISWLNMQLTMLKVPLPAGTGSQTSDRAQAYCGIAAYEAVVPGMPAYQSLTGQLTDFPAMPSVERG